ncbi:hypothetical protein ALC56_06089, partial [Trachymyrmex septentrionalis]
TFAFSPLIISDVHRFKHANVVTDRDRRRPPRDETEPGAVDWCARACIDRAAWLASGGSGRRTGIIRRGAIARYWEDVVGDRCFRTAPFRTPHSFCSWCAAGWPTGSSPFTSPFIPAPSSGYYVATASLVVIV